jgi:hypothetical protein
MEAVSPRLVAPKKDPAVIFFWVLFSPQLGQAGSMSASEKETILSKDSPQFLQAYSYKGIF